MATFNISEIIDLVPDSKIAPSSVFGEESNFDLTKSIEEALAQPIDFPPLPQAVLDEDTVCLPVEPGIPNEEQVAAILARTIRQIGVEQERICVLLPEGATEKRQQRFRDALSRMDCSECHVEMHRASDPECQGYLGPSESGEPISLNARLVHADFVLPIARAKPFGWKSQTDFLYPYYSDLDSQKRFFKLNPRHRVALNQEVQRWLGCCFQVSIATRIRLSKSSSENVVDGKVFSGEIGQVNRAVADHFESCFENADSQQPHDLVIAGIRPHLCLTREEIFDWVHNLKELCSPRGSIVLIWDDENQIPTLLDSSHSDSDSLNDELDLGERSVFLQSDQPLLNQLGMSQINDLDEFAKLIGRHESVLVVPDFINDFVFHRPAASVTGLKE